MGVSSFGIIGGDLRMAYAACYLERAGYAVTAAGLEKTDMVPAHLKGSAEEALSRDAVILPLPLLGADGNLFAPFAQEPFELPQLLEMPLGGVLFGGRVPVAFAGRIRDYYGEESLQLRNALPTAEGALFVLMEALPVTVWGSKIGVLGFGRTGHAAACLFKNVGAEVTVFARRGEARVLAETMGFYAASFDDFAAKTAGFHALVNTVPTPILSQEMLLHMDRNCFLLDIASAPWGFDAGAAESLGFRARRAPALPGRAAPATAGAYIAQTVLEMLGEREGGVR